jgi:hypothetical protein
VSVAEPGLEDVMDRRPEVDTKGLDDCLTDEAQVGIVVEHFTGGLTCDADNVSTSQPEAKVLGKTIGSLFPERPAAVLLSTGGILTGVYEDGLPLSSHEAQRA